MRLARTHRRLSVLMGLAGLLAFAAGAGVEPGSALLAGAGLLVGLWWQPSPDLSARMERAWLPIALLLVVRALFHVLVVRDDVVIPVVDLLFLLLVAEALRDLGATNDARLYSLSFALLLAATAYRPGLVFALAFGAYLVLATLALTVGHTRFQGRRHGAPDLRLPGSLFATMSGLSVVALFFSVMVFLLFPRTSQGWGGGGQARAGSLAGFADEVTLGSHGSSIYGNPQIVLRVEFPDGPPPGDASRLYWRGRSYDHFDGIRWSRSPRLPPSLAPQAWYTRWSGDTIVQRVYAAPLESRVLFALHPLLDVEVQSRIQPVPNNSGDLLYWGSASPTYQVRSLAGRPSPEQLRSVSDGFVPARPYYVQLPSLSPAVVAIADSLLSGPATEYDKVVALERWFRAEFTYTRELPRTAAEASLDYFLVERRAGHCEYFSTAMVVLLRTQGIAAREVNGFLGGEWSEFGSYLAVTQNQAHAWVEVWFPGFGWVPFDPTPPGPSASPYATAWFWPGRFFLDAVQHRWNKWVLDYSSDLQAALLTQGRERVVRGTRRLVEPSSPGRWGPRFRPVWWILGILLVLAAAVRALRRGGGGPASREAKAYVRLREAARRAGLPSMALHSPYSLTRQLEAMGHPASDDARLVVDEYLRARFSGGGSGTGDADRAYHALRRARRSLLKGRGPARGGGPGLAG